MWRALHNIVQSACIHVLGLRGTQGLFWMGNNVDTNHIAICSAQVENQLAVLLHWFEKQNLS